MPEGVDTDGEFDRLKTLVAKQTEEAYLLGLHAALKELKAMSPEEVLDLVEMGWYKRLDGGLQHHAN